MLNTVLLVVFPGMRLFCPPVVTVETAAMDKFLLCGPMWSFLGVAYMENPQAVNKDRVGSTSCNGHGTKGGARGLHISLGAFGLGTWPPASTVLSI